MFTCRWLAQSWLSCGCFPSGSVSAGGRRAKTEKEPGWWLPLVFSIIYPLFLCRHMAMRIGNQGYPRSFCSRTTPSKILPTFQHIPLCQLQPQWNHKPCISGLQGSANPSYSIMVLKVRSRETQGSVTGECDFLILLHRFQSYYDYK